MKTTGQIFVRGPYDQADKKVWGICGLIAFDQGLELKAEHQYVVFGQGNTIHIATDMEIDLTKQARGMSYSNIMCSPLWRV